MIRELNYVYVIAAPYPQRLIAKTVDGISRAAHRWLSSLSDFREPTARVRIAGVGGLFGEHLCRMVSSARQVQVGLWSVWELLRARHDVREWGDEDTLSLLDSLIAVSVYVETFDPLVMLAMDLRPPAPEWWIEPLIYDERPPVRTTGAVRYAVQAHVARHLSVPPDKIGIILIDDSFSTFGAAADHPIAGFYQTTLHMPMADFLKRYE
jgi:hypothetical protein